MNDQRTTSVGEAPDEERATPASSEATDSQAGPGAGAAAGAAPATADLDALRHERDELKDLLLRKTAEFDNYRRRIERERRELTEYAAAELLRELLPIVDNLERALLAGVPSEDRAAHAAEATGGAAAVQAYRTGVELIQRQLLELLRTRGVTPIDSVGTDFDPHVHQAVTREQSETHREGEVIAEMARGYKLGDRLLRPAMVKVATRD